MIDVHYVAVGADPLPNHRFPRILAPDLLAPANSASLSPAVRSYIPYAPVYDLGPQCLLSVFISVADPYVKFSSEEGETTIFPCIVMDLEKTCTKILPLHSRDRIFQCSVPTAHSSEGRVGHGVERSTRIPSRCKFSRKGES